MPDTRTTIHSQNAARAEPMATQSTFDCPLLLHRYPLEPDLDSHALFHPWQPVHGPANFEQRSVWSQLTKTSSNLPGTFPSEQNMVEKPALSSVEKTLVTSATEGARSLHFQPVSSRILRGLVGKLLVVSMKMLSYLSTRFPSKSNKSNIHFRLFL